MPGLAGWRARRLPSSPTCAHQLGPEQTRPGTAPTRISADSAGGVGGRPAGPCRGSDRLITLYPPPPLRNIFKFKPIERGQHQRRRTQQQHESAPIRRPGAIRKMFTKAEARASLRAWNRIKISFSRPDRMAGRLVSLSRRLFELMKFFSLRENELLEQLAPCAALARDSPLWSRTSRAHLERQLDTMDTEAGRHRHRHRHRCAHKCKRKHRHTQASARMQPDDPAEPDAGSLSLSGGSFVPLENSPLVTSAALCHAGPLCGPPCGLARLRPRV